MPYRESAIWESLAAWVAAHWPTVYGVLLSILIAWLRITYGGGRGRARTLEMLLCGAITLAASSGFAWIGIPGQASGFVGGMIGLLGVDTLRDAAKRFLDKKSQ
ncbi:phage holin, lambda family [Aeromonas hydrophila]|uniref:phage holin, lambda family n=1 Tax=Aeromonas hydrophila TaxID=644 RepID=UPI000575CD59|nr:phage holin, lambda family [Aeromonas hydrophila]KHN59935.1 holin [Aeromonas hydrophila]OFC42753.1 phage holin, lambda family [Aeromonas hydrophila]OFC52649.1 phage holin, lambda family [Aeromonas hydrophila]